MLAYSLTWLNYKKAEENFIKARKDFFSDSLENQIDDLTTVFTSGTLNDILLALEFLKVSEPKYHILIKYLVKISIDGNEIAVFEARQILLQYKNYKSEILLSIESCFNDQKDYYVYGNIAQLLYELKYKEELSNFIEKYCKNNDNEDIRYIYEDYKE
jgi:hypothetical protein